MWSIGVKTHVILSLPTVLSAVGNYRWAEVRQTPKFSRRIQPNVRLGSARQHETIRPKFGRTSANIRRHCGFKLAAFCARRWR